MNGSISMIDATFRVKDGPVPGGKRQSKATGKVKKTRRPARGGLPGVPSWTKFFGPLLGARAVKPAKDSKDPVVIEVLSYEITTDPIEDNPADYGLTAAELDHITQVSQALHDQQPAGMVQTLEALVEKFPQVPKVWNHLAVAYQAAGRNADSERIIEETYHRFPDYLFSLTNYGLQRVYQGHPEDVPTILRGTFALHDLQHGRKTYHLSEIRSFFGLLAMYFLAIQDQEQAARYLDTLEELDPDHPMTQMVRSKMMLSLFTHMHDDE